MFFELDAGDFWKVTPLYAKEEIIFPLMLSVIKLQQRGWVFVDDPTHPGAALVINNFGFMQFIGSGAFDQSLMKFLQAPGLPIPSYLLWYAPSSSFQSILDGIPEQTVRRERARFGLNPKRSLPMAVCPAGFEVKTLNQELLEDAHDFNLEIGSRFWASPEDFLQHGVGVCVVRDGEMISLCYSACVADGLAEIDIATREEYRAQGFGALAAQAFIRKCQQRGLSPTWDCFVHNTSSVKLAIKLGFEQIRIYPFYSFNIPLIESTDLKGANWQ